MLIWQDIYRMKYFCLILTLCVAGIVPSPGMILPRPKRYTISGYVRDGATGETLIGATLR